CVRKEETFDYW
nr:immunoglobulin heavy chain junction region [Macaca mulatta]